VTLPPLVWLVSNVGLFEKIFQSVFFPDEAENHAAIGALEYLKIMADPDSDYGRKY
jgi:hypothetical protein